jgi:iron complex transport system ATP-binding protein
VDAVSAIGIRDVSVAIGRAQILRNVTLSVEPGEWVGLIGPNGAGKTTLLRVIAGLAEHTGDVLFDGAPAVAMRKRERARRVALVPQRPMIPPGMSVAEYVLMGRTPYIRYLDVESAADLAVVAEVLRQLDIVRFAERPMGSLSGGEQQRAILARALAQRAPVLMLDEGTSELDIGSQQEVLELVAELRAQAGLTVVTAMHDLTLAAQFAERLVLLEGGRVAARGAPREVLTAEAIRAHYGAEVTILERDGAVVVVPVRRG